MLNPEDIWQDWPRCPRCGQRRQAVCPLCRCAQDEMPLADYIPQPAPLENTRPQRESCGGGCCQQSPEPVEIAPTQPESCETAEGTEAGPILLLCPQCDEAFTPTFYRLCQPCGHDFGDGVPSPTEESVESNSRALFVMFLLAAVAAGILGYCWFLFRR